MDSPDVEGICRLVAASFLSCVEAGDEQMTPEAKVKSEVLEYLKATGRYYMRLQSGCVKVRGAFMHLCPVGTSDVLTFADDGGCIWIELKQLKGKQREAQIAFEHRMRAMGHRYVVVRCVEDVMRVFAKEAGK